MKLYRMKSGVLSNSTNYAGPARARGPPVKIIDILLYTPINKNIHGYI